MKQSELLSQLITTSEQLNKRAEEIKRLSILTLEKRPNEKAWNTLECFEHLNLYIDIYNEFFEKSLSKTTQINEDNEVISGLFGGKFINMMEPKGAQTTKMKTFTSKNPINKSISNQVIEHFIQVNSKTINYLKQAQGRNIQDVKCKLAIPLLQLKLSDSFQFIIAHNKRHFIQIERNLN